jgi:hypothetical protein
MAVKTFTSEILTSSDTNTYLANGGLVYVAQATIGTGVSAVAITNCFSTTYDNYLISIANATCTNDGAVYFKLLSGSTATTSGFYSSTYYFQPGVASGLGNAVFTNTGYCESLSQSTASSLTGTFNVNSPFIARYSTVTAMGVANDYGRYVMAVHKANTSYNGFQIEPPGGTLTGGTVTVYGFRKG